jgi:nitrite reductase (NADH) small subunit
MSDWIEVCRLEDIPQGGARTVIAADAVIAVFRLGDDEVRAVENRCPHKGGPLAEGIVSGHDVLCPLHNQRIHLDSGEVAPPDSGCVRTFETRVSEGRVLLRAGK